MAILTYSSRQQIEEHTFHPAVTLLVPLLAIFLQAYLPLRFHWFALLDLPLIVVIFFAVSRRSPIAGIITGALIGLVQDGLTGQPIGINGISKTVIGYAAASVGVRIDVENPLTRVLLNFSFMLMNGALYYFILRYLLGQDPHWLWRHELLRATLNAVVALFIFGLLDRTKSRE
ncbi:MAG: rod shape-determining protein MreD [Acidobacteriaceae bacterium]